MPQVFPSNSLLQKPPPPTRSPPQPPPPPLNSLLPWDTSCSNAPLASYLEYILILLTLPPVTSSKSLGLHQMTFRPLSSVKKKHPARLFPVKVEGTATENCWQTRKKRMQWYFRGFNRHETDFYSLISFLVHLLRLLKWKEHLTKTGSNCSAGLNQLSPFVRFWKRLASLSRQAAPSGREWTMWHWQQQTGGTKVWKMCSTKSISMSAKGGLSKGVSGWTEVWSHISVSPSAGNKTTTFRLSISFKIYKCQSMSFTTPVNSLEPTVQVKSRPEQQAETQQGRRLNVTGIFKAISLKGMD